MRPQLQIIDLVRFGNWIPINGCDNLQTAVSFRLDRHMAEKFPRIAKREGLKAVQHLISLLPYDLLERSDKYTVFYRNGWVYFAETDMCFVNEACLQGGVVPTLLLGVAKEHDWRVCGISASGEYIQETNLGDVIHYYGSDEENETQWEAAVAAWAKIEEVYVGGSKFTTLHDLLFYLLDHTLSDFFKLCKLTEEEAVVVKKTLAHANVNTN